MCSECLANLQRNAAGLRPSRRSSGLPGPPPTAAALERHAAKFGPAFVHETAAEYGLEVVVEIEKARRKRGKTLKQRVAALVEAGHSLEVIAEVEDLSPARARKLVEEVGK